jgi:hypothetical protein
VLHLDPMIHTILLRQNSGSPTGFKFSRLNINKRAAWLGENRRIIRLFTARRFAKDTTLTTISNETRVRAEASFRKEERAKEGAKAMMEYQANSRMVREKTERLKVLRLAKEATDKERVG